MARGTTALLVIAFAALPAMLSAQEYAGSRACRSCHTATYDRYVDTPMGRSMSPAGALTSLAPQQITIQNEPLKRTFEVWTEKGTLMQAEASEQFRSSYPVAWAIGSGMNGISFVVSRGDHLIQAPLSYYARTRTWAPSPGYENADYGFNRPIAAACIACHSGRPLPVTDRPCAFASPPFRELAIGCENCHGPGSAHIRSGGTRQSIVNPARLSARRAEDICMYCHQGGDTRIVQPSRTITDFRPGQVLNDTVAIFRIPRTRENSKDTDLLQHHESMRLSRCYRASAGKLNCITCHNPHGNREIRDACLSCHRQAFAASHPPKTSDCAGCHMPKRDVGFIAHSALTNHRIVRRPSDPLPDTAYQAPPPDLPNLVHFNREAGTTLPLLTKLQAYGELVEKRPDYYDRFQMLLEEAAKAHPADPLVLGALGRRSLRTDQNGAAITWLRKAVENGSVAYTTYEDLADALSRTGQLQEAVAVLRRGIALAPYVPVLQKSLVVRLIKLGSYDEARQALETYVATFPEDDFMRRMLAQVSGPR